MEEINEILMQSFLSIVKDRVTDWVELNGYVSNKRAVDVDGMERNNNDRKN